MLFHDPLGINFVERKGNNFDVLRSLAERYHATIRDVIVNHEPYCVPTVNMEVTMNLDDLTKLCEDLRRAVLEPVITNPLMDITYTTYTTPLPPSVTATPTRLKDVTERLGGPLTFEVDKRPCIKCTAEQKEKFIRMIERYCDTCFLGECDPIDEDDCRKCLERRVRWEIE